MTEHIEISITYMLDKRPQHIFWNPEDWVKDYYRFENLNSIIIKAMPTSGGLFEYISEESRGFIYNILSTVILQCSQPELGIILDIYNPSSPDTIEEFLSEREIDFISYPYSDTMAIWAKITQKDELQDILFLLEYITVRFRIPVEPVKKIEPMQLDNKTGYDSPYIPQFKKYPIMGMLSADECSVRLIFDSEKLPEIESILQSHQIKKLT